MVDGDRPIKFLSPAPRPKAHFYGYTVTTRMYIGFSGVFTVTSNGYVRLRSHLGLRLEPSGLPALFSPGRGFFSPDIADIADKSMFAGVFALSSPDNALTMPRFIPVDKPI